MTASTTTPAIDWYFQGDGDSLVDSAVASLGQPPPPMMAVLAEPDTISVLPSLDASFPRPPSPWTHVPEVDSWACDPAALTPDQAPTRWPALLPLGIARGGVLLVSLEEVSPLSITGEAPDVSAVLRAWVMNLLLTPRRVVAATVAATRQLSTVGSDRFITAPDAEALSRQCTDRGVTPDVVILDDGAGAELFPSTPCVITTQQLPDGWDFRVAGSTATLTNTDRQLALPLDAVTAIDDTTWHDMVECLQDDAAQARSVRPPAVPDTPESRETLPPPPVPQPQPGQDTALVSSADQDPDEEEEPHIWVRVMGKPMITPPGGRTIDVQGRVNTWTSIIAYLATHRRGGATREDIRSACWPATSNIQPETVRQTLSRIRDFLGKGPDGEDLLPSLSRGGRRSDSEPPQKEKLHKSVLSDWERWLQLVGDNPADATDVELAKALALVRGPAWDVTADIANRYEYAKHLADTMTDAVPDAALILAERCTKDDDTVGAAAAAAAGLKANPQRQDLWRILLSSVEGVEHAQLSDQFRQAVPNGEIEPATRKLLA